MSVTSSGIVRSGAHLGIGTGRVNPHGLRVGYSRVRVRVALPLPVQNPYPNRGSCGYRPGLDMGEGLQKIGVQPSNRSVRSTQ
jgi:hypothetical protein